MRRVIGCLIICFLAIAVLGQKPQYSTQRKTPLTKSTPTPSEPSLAETEEWLKNKILTSAFYKTWIQLVSATFELRG